MSAVNISLRVFKVSKIKIRKHKVTHEIKMFAEFAKSDYRDRGLVSPERLRYCTQDKVT